MAHWLVKTEPGTYSFSDLLREGQTVWDGVKNALALKHLKEFRKQDEVFIYHTGDEKAIVGIAEVVSDPYSDSRTGLTVVDLQAGTALPRAVRLAEIKADSSFKGFPLVRLPRLSVMPVAQNEWDRVLQIARA